MENSTIRILIALLALSLISGMAVAQTASEPAAGATASSVDLLDIQPRAVFSRMLR